MLVLLLVQKSARQAAPAPAGEEEEAGPDLVSDRSQALAGLARAGARSNRRPCAPQRYTFLPAVLRARNFVLRCRLVQSGGTLSYLQCRCALCWEQQFSAVPSAREIFNAASELELENVGALW